MNELENMHRLTSSVPAGWKVMPPPTHTHFAHGHHGQSVCHGDNMQYLHFEPPLPPINTPWKCIYVSFIAFPVDVIEVYMLSVTAHL